MIPNLKFKIQHEELGQLTCSIGIGQQTSSIAIKPQIISNINKAYQKNNDIMDAISALYMSFMGNDKATDIIGFFYEISNQIKGPEDLVTKFCQLYDNIYVKKIMLANDTEDYFKKTAQANENPYSPHTVNDDISNGIEELHAGNTIICEIKNKNGTTIYSSQTEIKKKGEDLFAYLDHHSTSEQYRGKGIASIGLDKLEEYLQINDIPQLILEVGEIGGVNHYDLEKFYTNRGYENLGNGKFTKRIYISEIN